MPQIKIKYSDLIKFCRNESFSRLNISRESSRVYCSRFLQYMNLLSFESNYFINPSIFDFSNKNLETKLITALNFLYKSFILILIDSQHYNRFEIVEIGFCSGVHKRIAGSTNKFFSWDLQRFIEELEKNELLSIIEIEDLFLLPKGVLSMHIRPKLDRKIPKYWWPERYNSKKYAKKRSWVIKYAFLDLLEGEELTQVKFFQVIDFVDREGYLIEHTRNLRDYKAKHPKKTIYISKSLQDEIDDWASHKTNNDKAGEIQKTICCTATINLQKFAFKRFLIFIRTYLESIGESCVDDELSLALLINPKYVIAHINENRDMAKKYNSASEKIVKIVISMLQPDRGWLWRRDDLITKLPKQLQEEINKQGGWHSYCAIAKQEIRNYYNNVISKQMDISFNTKSRAKSILDLDKPLSRIYYGLECWRKDMVPRMEKSEDFARELQDYVIVFLMINFPLRTKNWSLMKHNPFIKKDNYLQLSTDQEWTLHIPKSELKNGYNSKNLKHVSHVIYPLSNDDFMQADLKLLWLFIFEYRPLINKTEFLFLSRRNEQFSPSTASSIVRRFSLKFVSKFSRFPSKNQDVEPFGSHLLRTLKATHHVKNGSIEEAAAFLVDHPATVREHYVVDDINQKLKRAAMGTTAEKLGIKK